MRTVAAEMCGSGRGRDRVCNDPVGGSCSATGLKRLFALRLVDAVPIRRGRIMAEGLDAFGVHMIKRADAETFSSLAAGVDCVQCLRPILFAGIPQHLGRELVQFYGVLVP